MNSKKTPTIRAPDEVSRNKILTYWTPARVWWPWDADKKSSWVTEKVYSGAGSDKAMSEGI